MHARPSVCLGPVSGKGSRFSNAERQRTRNPRKWLRRLLGIKLFRTCNLHSLFLGAYVTGNQYVSASLSGTCLSVADPGGGGGVTG